MDGARQLAEKLRLKIENQQFAFMDNRLSVTITLGVVVHKKSKSIEETLKRADLLLYQGKKQGRNCVVADSS